MPHHTHRDKELAVLAQARRGHQRAFRSLYERHADALFRFLGQFSMDRHETQDWVQRAFIKAFERIGSFDDRSSFRTWLFRIGINEMNMDRRRMHVVDLSPAPDESVLAGGEPTDELMWDHTMRGWLSALDQQKQSVFVLHEVEGFGHDEIASILDITASHSRTILTRVRRYLKEEWEKERRAQ